jgi:hypothetical protein
LSKPTFERLKILFIEFYFVILQLLSVENT